MSKPALLLSKLNPAAALVLLDVGRGPLTWFSWDGSCCRQCRAGHGSQDAQACDA
jgi:hypothetical protein